MICTYRKYNFILQIATKDVLFNPTIKISSLSSIPDNSVAVMVSVS